MGASSVAVMLSMAKGSDTPGKSLVTQVFCRVAPDGGIADLAVSPPVPWDRVGRVLALGPFGGETLQESTLDALPRPATLLTTGPDPVHGTDADGMERIDWRVVERQTREICLRFMASSEPEMGPPTGAAPPAPPP